MIWVPKLLRIHPTMKECNYIQHHFLLLTWISYPPDLFGYTIMDYMRKWWLVTKYWINFEMVFITDQPFLDSFKTCVSVKPLGSRLYLSRTFTFISILKEWNYLINSTLLEVLFSNFLHLLWFSNPWVGKIFHTGVARNNFLRPFDGFLSWRLSSMYKICCIDFWSRLSSLFRRKQPLRVCALKF